MSDIAVLRCVGVVAKTGERCGKPAKPGSRRCGFHTTVPPERARCQHTWENGQRCEGAVPSARVGVEQVCSEHRRPCRNPDCGRKVGLLDGLCHPCSSRLAREAAELVRAAEPKATHRQRWEATFAHLPRCVEMSAESGERCSREAVPPSERCVKHQDIPADADRCAHAWENGKRCPRRAVTKRTQRCTHHRVGGKTGRPVAGVEPVFRPCEKCGKPSKGTFGCADHAPRCSGVTSAGAGCDRTATVKVGEETFCKTHAHRPVTPPPAAPTGPAAACGVPSGKEGAACAAPAVSGKGRCHKHLDVPSDDDRCLHLYTGGDRCPARSRKAHGHGHGTMCALHAVPCLAEGCDQAVSDTVRQLCRAHAPRCDATVPSGSRCGSPAAPGSHFCGSHQHEPDEPRCSWMYGSGERCRNSLPARGRGQVWRDLCQHHQLPCGLPEGCDNTTAFADGLCVKHRPRCEADGCQRPAFAGDLCWKHHGVVEEGLCALLTKDGQACQNVAAHTTDDDGRICAHHHTTMPAEEERCLHQHPSGERCALTAQAGTAYCVPHGPAHSTSCSWTTPSGAGCSKPVVPRRGEAAATCETHRRVPDDAQRCRADLPDGQRCPASRLTGSDRCVQHTPRATCSATAPSGDRCDRTILMLSGRPDVCHQHAVLPPWPDRCAATLADGSLCPGRRQQRRDYCDHHAFAQDKCVAVDDRDVRCRSYAPRGETLCDRHSLWFPGKPYDRPDEHTAFFLRPRMDLAWEILTAMASSPDVQKTGPNIVSAQAESGGKALTELAFLEDDPYDLTGARRYYTDLVEDGMPEADARRAAEFMSKRYATNTVKNLTKQLRPYLEWCQENACVPMPASRTTVVRFLTYLTTRGRVWDGQPLSSGTMTAFRNAIAQAHIIAKQPDPFEVHPELVALLKGYDRVYARTQVQAHAIRLDELAALVAAATAGSQTNLRDLVIATVLADPEVGMTLAETEKWSWENTSFAPGGDTKVSIWKGRASSPKRNDLVIPNRAAAVSASGQDFPVGEVPLEARMCGTASLQALAAERIASGQPLTGPVLCKDDGTAISKQAVMKSLANSAARAGLDYAPTYAFDDRVRLVEALGEPSIMGLRDAAVMALSWWASLRRSEVSGLDVGDIGKDSRGRGLVVLVRKSKTDAHGQYVPVPYARGPKGQPMPVDVAHRLHLWMAAYAQHLGRELDEKDPLFINLKRNEPSRLGEKGVGDIVTRYTEAAGVQAEMGERLSSHGFRAGYATEWLATGRPSEPLAKRQRRKSTASLLGYFRLADPFEDGLAFSFESPEDASLAFEMKQLEAQFRQQEGS